MSKPRILITGGSSYVGRHLVPLASDSFETHYTYFSQDVLVGTNGHQLDVRSLADVQALVNLLEPTAIIHLAGSNRTPDMHNVIVQGTANVGAAAEAVGARFVHLSTDVVFDGTKSPYFEDDLPDPIHAYGRAKAESEIIAKQIANSVIVRTSLVYGLSEVDHAAKWMMDGLNAGNPVTLFTDQWRNPIWVQTLSLALIELVMADYVGILHIVGQQSLNRAQFGERLLNYFNFQQRDTLHFEKGDSSRWPPDLRLNNDLAKSILQTPLLGVDAVLNQK